MKSWLRLWRDDLQVLDEADRFLETDSLNTIQKIQRRLPQHGVGESRLQVTVDLRLGDSSFCISTVRAQSMLACNIGPLCNANSMRENDDVERFDMCPAFHVSGVVLPTIPVVCGLMRPLQGGSTPPSLLV